jgi:F0F1-type ATP synthase delta subunit
MQDVIQVLVPIIAAHVVVLAVLVVAIKRVLVSDARRAVKRIAEVETEVRNKEESIRREIAEHEKDFARRKAEAEADMQRAREKSEKDVGQMREQMLAEAKKEGNHILEQAHRNEARFRMQIAQEMEEKAVEYGAEIFKLVFSEKIGVELHEKFMEELLDALSEIDGASVTVDGDDAEFTSSHPISPPQKERFQALLKEKFGVDVAVNEKVDETLLAGLVFKLGSLEIDGSLLNRYKEAAAEVVKEAHERVAVM